MAGKQMQSNRYQSEVHALATQQTEVEKQIAKLEATTANVTLNTVPPRTNPGARLRPESVTLSLQCASGRITLENLNFPNKAVLTWAMANCCDTSLSIRYAGLAEPAMERPARLYRLLEGVLHRQAALHRRRHSARKLPAAGTSVTEREQPGGRP